MWMTFLALRNAIAVLMASLGITILGFVALARLPIDLFPNINLPIINIGTVYTGAGVLDIEKTVTYPIEKAVSAVSDVKFVESKSRQGLSTVRLWLNWGQLYAKRLSVLDVVRAVKESNFLLPAGDIKVGRLDYNIYTNNQFKLLEPMGDIVVKRAGANGTPIHIKDLGYVVDSAETQTAVVRIDGSRRVFMRVNM